MEASPLQNLIKPQHLEVWAPQGAEVRRRALGSGPQPAVALPRAPT